MDRPRSPAYKDVNRANVDLCMNGTFGGARGLSLGEGRPVVTPAELPLLECLRMNGA